MLFIEAAIFGLVPICCPFLRTGAVDRAILSGAPVPLRFLISAIRLLLLHPLPQPQFRHWG